MFFLKLKGKMQKNILVGVIYRAHTSIDDFTLDLDKVLIKNYSENKITYVMGDFNIHLLKDDTSKPIQDYIDFIYWKSLIPTIYIPLIDNILTNCENNPKSAIIVTDISDHMATALVSNLSLRVIQHRKEMFIIKDVTVMIIYQSLKSVFPVWDGGYLMM